MTTRKRLEGALAEWHPHPKDHNPAQKSPENNSLVPVVREASATDEIAERFFDSAPELPTPEPPMAVEPEPRRVAIDSAAVRARRRYLMRYVAGAVSLAGIIGLAAIVRMTIARDASAAGTPHATSAIAAALPVVATPDPQVAVTEPQAAPVDPQVADPIDPKLAVAADPVAADPPVASNAPAADPAAAADPPAPAASENGPANSKSAADAKKDAQRALDRGHVADSIEAGEESVALDPTDADAWLILGAAYQMQGNSVAARRCFASCVRQAKRGNRGECGGLLR
jgi:hypothetical protein